MPATGRPAAASALTEAGPTRKATALLTDSRAKAVVGSAARPGRNSATQRAADIALG
ncbi:hypothetical protein ACPCAC_04525 [Streptomyces lavendulocolor]|uniref:hypothetical protein n=1 Tax=Streptomyces lavendulocolor TaxID=67316 RepID=UPI003C2FE965